MTRTRLLPTAIALILGLVGALLLLFTWHLPPFSDAAPRTENAYLRAEVTMIAPRIAGTITEIAVSDYQPVTRGQVIARLDDRSARQRLAQAEAQLLAAQAGLTVARQSIASAEAAARADRAGRDAAVSALDTAREDAGRADRLSDRGVTSRSAADQARLALQQAEAARIQAEARLDVQAEAINSARVAVEARQADIAAAEAAVGLARIALDDTVIRAPADGTLGQLGVHLGQYVGPGSALVPHVGDDLWVLANFRETALQGLEPGSAVRFRVDALDHQEFRGHVQMLSPATASEFSLLPQTSAAGNFTKVAQRLPVRIAIDPDQPRSEALRAGMSVVVDARG